MLSTYNTQALTQALTSDLALSSPRIIFPPRGCCTNDTEKQAQWQVRHFRLHYLLTGWLAGWIVKAQLLP